MGGVSRGAAGAGDASEAAEVGVPGDGRPVRVAITTA